MWVFLLIFLFNFGPSQAYLPRTYGAPEQSQIPSDVGVPDYIPPFVKTPQWANAYSKNTGTKSTNHYSGVKTSHPASGGVKTSGHSYSGAVKTSGHYTGGVKTSSHLHTGGGVKTSGHFQMGGGSFNVPSFGMSDLSMTYKGGCADRPKPPMNAALQCSMNGGCKATCMQGYTYPNGDTTLILSCIGGEWEIQGKEWPVAPNCEPFCLPSCQNNGICISPDNCDCPENFSGAQCQFENKPCVNYPPLPMNSRRMCNSESCTLACMEGHQFPDGSTITNLICKEGQWVPQRPGLTTVPDCKPICSPPCQHGGVCLSFNTCQCPQDFRGSHCEYAASACSMKNLNFNGGYNCSGDGDSFSCSLNCPVGVEFSITPAPVYTCTYDTGIFLPQPIPKCVFGSEIFSAHGSHLHSGNSMHLKSPVHTGEMSPNEANIDFKHFGPHHHSPHSTKHVPTSGDSSNDFITNEVVEVIKDTVDRSPHPATCVTWGGSHYRTFDGKTYSIRSSCRHILVRESRAKLFTVAVEGGAPKPKRLYFYLNDNEYMLEKKESGSVVFHSSRRLLPIPVQLPGLRVEIINPEVVVSLDSYGAKIIWDTEQTVQVKITESLWNRTEGLCGTADGDSSLDLLTPDGKNPKSALTGVDSWKFDVLGQAPCDDNTADQHACTLKADHVAQKASEFCHSLISKSKFGTCSEIMDIKLALKACEWDYCSCPSGSSPTDCACASAGVYADICSLSDPATLIKWRDLKLCPLNCTGGRIYMACGPVPEQTCGAPDAEHHSTSSCKEGCFCPEGLYLDNGKCVPKEECPCRLRSRSFLPGSTVPKQCNTCTCESGSWTCTALNCGSRCGAIGDPHYQTFDGKRFDFMGKCSYYLIKDVDYCVEAENVACSGAISEAMGLSPPKTWEQPSCTKAVTIRVNKTTINLGQNNVIKIDGTEITSLPVIVNDIIIRPITSLFVLVELPNGLEVRWDGTTRVYVDAPASFLDKTKGLCGTFNHKQKDDFFTPEGDIEDSVPAFANKWKTGERCEDVSTKEPDHPCDVNIQNKVEAVKLCNKLKSSIFEGCHWFVDVEVFYQSCLYDMCACKSADVSRCLCPILGAYSQECADQGVPIQWRHAVTECELACPAGQSYTVCADTCSRTCWDLSRSTISPCRPQCAEGCACTDGEVLDSEGICVPRAVCPCHRDQFEFPAGYKEIRAGIKHAEVCSCIGATWQCREATDNDIKDYPRSSDLKDKCSAVNNEEFTTCELAEPITCKNMHGTHHPHSDAHCQPGCKCKSGFVLDIVSKKCVRPSQCPCHHGGRSYPDNYTVQIDCNSCSCNGGQWKCTENHCPGVCSAWGDSHFTTFDDTTLEFQGVCRYLMAKGALDTKEDSFRIEIQNEACGTTGVTCSKSVSLKVGRGIDEESVSFTKDKRIPDSNGLGRIKVRRAGVFVFADVPDLGLVLQWDRGTRVYIRLDPKWKGKVAGLCGNYNSDARDDFQTPGGGGLAEASPLIFADSWKLHEYCPFAEEVQDTCAARPTRRAWASSTCSILKRSPFTACHAHVPVGEWLTRCERDACACDSGGDCECVCTALASYAHACGAKGVPVKWRTEDLCPMQCDESCSTYSPCMSSCPVENCENTLNYPQLLKLCSQDPCVEGCAPKKCKDGEVHSNNSLSECIPRMECKLPCLVLDDETVIYEGEITEQDACHTCTCSRGLTICKGLPCSPTTEGQREQDVGCVTGWTAWINNNQPRDPFSQQLEPFDNTGFSEFEALPAKIQLFNIPNSAICNLSHMKRIECRTVEDQLSAKETGLDAECSLEQGLLCKDSGLRSCPDFEIRVYCECEDSTGIDMLVTTQHVPGAHEKPHHVTKSTPESFDFTTIPPLKLRLTTAVFEPPPYLLEPCDITSVPNRAHPGDCSKFYQCAPGMGPPEHPDLVLKNCGPGLLFNPIIAICDWPTSVLQINPKCGELQIEEPTIKPEDISLEHYTPPPLVQSTEGKSTPQTIIPQKGHRTTKTTKPFGTTPGIKSGTTPSAYLEPCDGTSRPNREYPGDCSKFYQCAPGMGPEEHPDLVVKTCGPSMYYNPNLMICDWAINVIKMKPDCGATPQTSQTTKKPHIDDSFTYPPLPTEKPTDERTPHDSLSHKLHTTDAPGKEQGVPSTPAYLEPCDGTSRPNREYPGDCSKFYQCAPGMGPEEHPDLVEKTCGPSMYYNPILMICDWAINVIKIKPECGATPQTSQTTKKPHIDDSFTYPPLPTEKPTDERTPHDSLSHKLHTTDAPGKEQGVPSTPAYLEPCDGTSRPNREYPGDCSKFYQCAPGMGPEEHPDLVEKTCGPSMYYNPNLMICDWAINVIKIKPECGATPQSSQTTKKPHIDDSFTHPPLPTEKPTDGRTPHDSLSHKLHTTDAPGKEQGVPSTPAYLEPCDGTSRPNREYPGDCSKFYQCAPRMGPQEHPDLVVKTCGPSMYYNPNLMICDWAINVIQMKPECGEEPPVQKLSTPPAVIKGHPTTPAHAPTIAKGVCADDEIWDDCAMQCDKLCLSYLEKLKSVGKCQNKQRCAGACVPRSESLKGHKSYCDPKKLRRDEHTCVPAADCTCITSKGVLVRPGELIAESACRFCQCLENHYACTETCTETPLKEISTKDIPVDEPKTSQPVDEFGTGTTVPDDGEITTEVTSTTVLVVPTTVSPPPECDPAKYTDVMWGDEPMSPESFTASSSIGDSFLPQYARLNGGITDTSAGSWSPAESDLSQYIQVKLPRLKPLYGVILQGSPLFDHFVTSYKVMYSRDGQTFDYTLDFDGLPKIFRGPIDANTPVRQMFDVPFEAKYVRIKPLTWHSDISLRMELIGCTPDYDTTPFESSITPTESSPSECKDPMGVADGKLPQNYITVSSEHPKHPQKYLSLDGKDAWRPLTNSPGEWILFDFIAPRNITGMVTAGGPGGWVNSYEVEYSDDGAVWIPVYDADLHKVTFPANFDHKNPVMNTFAKPINTRYLKVLPKKWHENIEMRIEPHGCFVAYGPTQNEPVIDFTIGPHGETPGLPENGTCQPCPGTTLTGGSCPCRLNPDKPFYDGDNCVARAECPCFVGLLSYAVGASYQSADCEECICKLGGVPHCKPKTCKACPKGQASQLVISSCTCKCAPCASDERLCPTSATCVPNDAWCDGVQHCPDDELDCPSTTAKPTKPAAQHTTTVAPSTTTKAPEVKKETCESPSCPVGYKVVLKKTHGSNPSDDIEVVETPVSSESLFAPAPRRSYMRYYRGGVKTAGGGGTKTSNAGTKTSHAGTKTSHSGTKSRPFPPPARLRQPITQLTRPNLGKEPPKESHECAQWRCVSTRPLPSLTPGKTVKPPEPCPVPECPTDYKISMEKGTLDAFDCPKYTCLPPPKPDLICDVTGRSLTTFDGVVLKHALCDHVLARDSLADTWTAILQKNCSRATSMCSTELLIIQDGDQIRLRPDLTVEYNGYTYTVDQTKKIGLQKESFAISQVGGTLLFISTKYNYWITYDKKGQIKIGVSGSLYGTVDGLCGVADGYAETDYRLPNGQQASGTEELVEGWERPGAPPNSELCEARACPITLQAQAWTMCNAVKDEVFAGCGKVMDLAKFRSHCLESVCDCVQQGNKTQACLCESLQQLAIECLASGKVIDLQGWRTTMNCPVECPAPLVHHDCWKRRCEPSCSEECPLVPGFCFPGCYCPEGTVRKGDDCVRAIDCQDCVCDGSGDQAKYVTFDHQEIPFSGNCTYIASRSKPNKGYPKFEIYITNAASAEKGGSVCVEALHVIFENHVVHVQKGNSENELQVSVDGNLVYNYPLTNDWLQLTQTTGKDITFAIPQVHLEVTSLLKNLAFSIKIPSTVYTNKTEGLCGVCAGNPEDGLLNADGNFTHDVSEYGLSWLAAKANLKTLGLEIEDSCVEKPKNECVPLPPEADPCFKLMDPEKFGQCHPVVDPFPFMASCQQDLCSTSKQTGICGSLEDYADACRSSGICINWRSKDLCPYECEQNLKYEACGPGCPLTCDNYKALSENPEDCKEPRAEGCFCPNGKVLSNDTCIEAAECTACNTAFGRKYEGNTWQQDACTKCSCTNEQVSCETITCASAIACPRGTTLLLVPAKTGECCDDFACVPEATVTTQCNEPQKMTCGFGQVLKLEEMQNGCHEFICQCKPQEECEVIPSGEFDDIEPGMERIIDHSGCCPQVKYVCKSENCPDPLCPSYLNRVLVNDPTKCCPVVTCEPLKDKCTYDLQWEAASKGGETRKNESETVTKPIGSTWSDGPCRTCNCQLSDKGVTPHALCSVTECSAITSNDDLVIEADWIPYQCCPVANYTGCKDNLVVHQIGDEWQSDENPCHDFNCAFGKDGKLEKTLTVQQCNTDCQPGWEYEPAKEGTKLCCGECSPVYCVVDGQKRNISEEWTSADNCATNICVNNNGTLHVEVSTVNCPEVADTLLRDFEVKKVKEDGQCCEKVLLIACKVDGVIYEEGSTWRSPGGDPCQNVTCSRDSDGNLIRTESQETCNDECQPGWVYEASKEADKCCGQCVQVACIVDKEAKAPGSIWYSADNCTEFSCDKISSGELLISANLEKCPDLADCPPERIYKEGCCERCNITALDQRSCMPDASLSNDTIGIVSQQRPGHGECVNTKVIPGFKECHGGCDSGTLYNKATGIHDTDCKCCQPIKFNDITVELECKDGFKYKKLVQSPSECSCVACHGGAAVKSTKTSHYQAGVKTAHRPAVKTSNQPGVKTSNSRSKPSQNDVEIFPEVNGLF